MSMTRPLAAAFRATAPCLCALVLLVACAGTHRKPASTAGPEPKRDPWCEALKSNATEERLGIKGGLAAVSEEFREASQRAKERECTELERQGLLIRYFFGNVEARFNGQSLGPAHSIYSSEVHALKAVSHTIQLIALLEAEAAAEQREHAGKSLVQVLQLRREFDDPSSQPREILSEEQTRRQIEILDAVIDALGRLRDGWFSPQLRAEFFASVRAPLMQNLRDASRTVLYDLHETVAEYRRRAETIDANAWSTVRVVAGVGHQSRELEVGVQYFARLLGETVTPGARGENRLVIAEGIFKPPAQRGLLAAHFVDRDASLLVFNDAARPQWDVLSDEAGVLEELLPDGR